ncbi:hypothetical protein GUITHDRAFT_152533 [Guillardia theta CCMP2712]|uniref:Transmembrane protein n=2 Tax=Guillardia theta TaxID=55529 RepID=L1JC83_GUITC|nr:hypothetical protein GUITHDRAFT_152533 [Guillardia theta CCMP2712]EKX46131.1 hypothetical protein GUITHDRAFT_152533 [Guillardia theta CCMP2712]|eukprot:XP_005833111.1 hypothetical protein GUITHDRAFT_152533 [Guillardia theta CCMP2712]
MMSAFVAFSLPPLLLWIFLLCGCFWMYGWLGLFASMQTLSALGLRGSEGEMQAQLMPQGLISPLLHLLALSPALYLLGPAWVLRCPPWLWHIPFPLNQRHWSQRLPAPARNPKELLSRNFACFALPMLFGCSFPSLLPAWQILQQVNLLESSGWVATFRAFLVLGTDTLPYLLVIGATLLACLPLLVYCLYLLYRGGELKRFFLMYSAVALAFLAVSVLVRKYYSFNLRGYLIFIALVPITAHDRHLCAALQGLLLGLCVQEIAGRGGELPLWEETSGRL